MIKRLFPVLLLLGGCLKADLKATLFADGSGRFTLTCTAKDGLGQITRTGSEGVVAWTDVAIGGGTFTGTAWFEDISKVKLMMEGDGAPVGFIRTTGSLEITDPLTPKIGLLPAFTAEQKAALLKMIGDYALSISITAPGTLTSVEGGTKDGRTATFTFDAAALISVIDDPDEAKKKLPTARKLSWEKDEVPDAEKADFKKALAAAKAKWDRSSGRLIAREPVDDAKRKKVAIVGVSDKSDYGKGKLGSVAHDALSSLLLNSRQFKMTDRTTVSGVLTEQKLGDDHNPVTAPRVGKILAVDVVVYGAVTGVGFRMESVNGLLHSGKRQVTEATVEIRAVHVETGEVMFSKEGKATISRDSKGRAFDPNATNDALHEAVMKILDDLIDVVK